MEHRTINIEHWKCEVFVALHGYRTEEVIDAMRECRAPESVISRIKDKLEKDEMDSGFTYSNPKLRKSVMVIAKTSEGRQFLNSFVHELRHLVDDIAVEDGLQMAGEGVAYLSGDIAMELSDLVCKQSCEHCRE